MAALLVLIVLILLPLLYLGLIAGVGYFTYWHAVFNWDMLKGPGVWFRVIGYAGPLVAGAILFFFMVKPLLARSAREGKERILDFAKQPILYAFVSCVAKALRAPEPKVIAVNCDVNASASLGSGLFAFLGNRMVLTIGLPLAAGLNTRELAGVIAHELGHFRQGGGMRLSFAVRSVNAWFVRLVYERDEWDEGLAEWCEESGRLAIIFIFAAFCVWVTRRILWVFMVFADAISCLLLRQMEYDADRCEAHLAGSKAFETTMKKLPAMTVVSQILLPALVQNWGKETLPEDLPALIVENTANIPPKERKRFEKAILKQKTGLLNSHPADKDRLASVKRLNAPGIFRWEQPSPLLFNNYAKLTRAVSKSYYRNVVGRYVEVLDEIDMATEAFRATV